MFDLIFLPDILVCYTFYHLPTKHRRTANDKFTKVYKDFTNLYLVRVLYATYSDTVGKHHVVI